MIASSIDYIFLTKKILETQFLLISLKKIIPSYHLFTFQEYCVFHQSFTRQRYISYGMINLKTSNTHCF